MGYLKHNANGNGKQPRKKAAEQTASTEPVRVIMQRDSSEVVSEADSIGSYGLLEIAEQLSKIQNSLKSYNVNACDVEMSFSLGLSTWDNHNPVEVQLTAGSDEEDCTVWIECEALDRIATAFERIADSMNGKAPGPKVDG